MRIIFNGEAEDALSIVQTMLDEREQFERDYLKIGNGWSFYAKPSRHRYFLRRIKSGISASICDFDD